jgi:addiction module HigA family antidote
MIEHVQSTYVPSEVSPPGETLRELLEERGVSQAELAVRMGRPKKTISEIINGKAAITPETALELELVLGVPASFWGAREAHYREYLARKEQERQLARAVSWCERFPVREMSKYGWLAPYRTKEECVRALLEFFGVASAEQWDEVFALKAVAFRRSKAFEADQFALAAWLRAGVVHAQRVDTQPFSRELFLETLKRARGLTRQHPSQFERTLVESCALAGVAVVFVPELPRSRASGATRWLSATKAIIQLSLRYRTDDHLWFTFFHEAAHLLLHGKRLVFIELNGAQGSPEEAEADRWAADFLIPPDDFRKLGMWSVYSKSAIEAFSEQIGVAPGIVVGRLQHEGLLPHTHCNDLKLRLEWAVTTPSD